MIRTVFTLFALIQQACVHCSAGEECAVSPTIEGVLLIADDSVEVFSRPGFETFPWAVLAPGEVVQPVVITSDGWLGFDPGVAQAGNSGSFRYRWIAPGGSFTLSGNPVVLAEIWGPCPGVAYAMTFDPVPVHSGPDPLSAVLDTLPSNSAAAVTGSAPGWLLVDPSAGPSPSTASGWVCEESVSVSR